MPSTEYCSICCTSGAPLGAKQRKIFSHNASMISMGSKFASVQQRACDDEESAATVLAGVAERISHVRQPLRCLHPNHAVSPCEGFQPLAGIIRGSPRGQVHAGGCVMQWPVAVQSTSCISLGRGERGWRGGGGRGRAGGGVSRRERACIMATLAVETDM